MRAITQCARIAQQVRFQPQSKSNNKNTRSKSSRFYYLVYLLFQYRNPNVRASPVICTHSALIPRPEHAI